MGTDPRIPLVILAGSDRRASKLPEAGADHHAIAALKGVDLTLGGAPLITRVIERWRAVPEVGPIWVAGPADRHRDVGADEVIDTDGTLAANVHAAVARACRDGRQGPVSFATCDVLPDLTELEPVRADLRRHPNCALWYPLVRFPEEGLGAFGWKPHYRLAPAPGEPAVPILPGHWLVIDPIALRMHFAEDLIDLAYRTRNRSVTSRQVTMMLTELGRFLWQDVRHVLALRAPLLTITLMTTGVRITRDLRRGDLDVETLGRRVRRMIVKARDQRRSPPVRVRFPIVDAVSLARDVDTREEAEELEREWRAGRA
jgi:hypothetical protein